MANRSYLYAADILPSTEWDRERARVIGISEWNWDLPTAFKLLLAGDPSSCPSMIWECADEISIVGCYSSGVQRLLRELDGLRDPRIRQLRAEAADFLSNPRNRRRWLILECGEILQMADTSMSDAMSAILKEIEALSRGASPEWPTKREETQGTNPSPQRNSPVRSSHDELDVEAFGLGNWSNVLYYNLSSS